MRIQHNIMAMNAYRNYNNNTSALSKNLEKLSSGYKINRAGDDAAGLAISEKMRAQITGLEAAQKNVKDGVSLVKTAEGAMQEIQDMLNRMDYLATQSANGTYDNEVDRANLMKEVTALKDEINRIADSANFNGIKLLDGSQTSSAMNTDAFSVTGADAVAAGIPSDPAALPTGNFPGNVVDFALHPTVQGNPTQANVAFKLDLADFDFKNTLTGTDTAAITFNIAGTSVGVEVNSATTAGGLAAALRDAVNGMVTTGASGMFIGDSGIAVSASGSGTVVEFNFAGIQDGANQSINATGEYSVSAAISANANLGKEISVQGAASVSISSPNHLHGLYDITDAAAKTETKTAGIDLTLDNNIVQDGNILTIDGKTYGFKLSDSTDFGAAGGASAPDVVIDLTSVKDKTSAEQIHEAVKQLTASANNSTTNFKITSTAPNKIHVDQTMASAQSGNVYTEDDLKSTKVFALQTGNEAKNAGTAINIDESKIRDGDKLVIDDKTYVFTTDASRYADDDSVTTVDLKNAAADLAAKLNDIAGQTAEVVTDADGAKSVVIRKDDATAAKAVVSTTGIASTSSGINGLTLQIGDTSDSFNQLKVSIGDMHTYAMGLGGDSIAEIDISTQEGAQKAVDVIKNAINYVSSVRGDLGAVQNRLEHTQNNLSVMAENIQDAESTIRDTDVAEEMMSYVKNNILVQSAQAMLAQANQVPQGVLQLLG